MVITPGYFAGALHKEALKTFFVDVAEASPIPVRLYSLFVYSLLHRDRARADNLPTMQIILYNCEDLVALHQARRRR